MTSESLFLLIPIFVVLLLFTITYSREILLNNLSELFISIAGYFFLLTDIKNDNKEIVVFNFSWENLNTFLLIIGCLFSLLAIYLSYNYKEKFKSYDDVFKRFNSSKNEYYKLCSDIIRNSFDDFFINSGNNGRVSIYLHESNMFKLLGRFSKNPNFNSKGRDSYPDNEGLICKGWIDSIYVVDNIPEWKNSGQKYTTFVSQIQDMDKDTIKNMKMKSRSFYIKRIDNEDSRTPYGIIVIEQISPTPIDGDLITSILEKHESNLIVLFKSMRSLRI